MTAKHVNLKGRGFDFTIPLFFLLLLALSFLFPYTGDDWAWGTQIGLDRLSSGFKDYNGRYLGNLLVLALTRNVVLRSVVVASTLFAIPLYIDRIVGRQDRTVFWLSSFLMLSMPLRIRSQGIAWTSGFTNYAFPALLILIYIDAFKDVFLEDYQPNPSILRRVGLIILGFSNSLFMENITILNIIMACALLLYTRIKHRIWDLNQLAFLVGSLAGAACMFTNGAYVKVVSAEDSYRSISSQDESPLYINAAKKYLRTIAGYFVLNNAVLNLSLALMACVALCSASLSNPVRFGLLLTLACSFLTAGSMRYPFSFPAEGGVYPHEIMVALTVFYGVVSFVLLFSLALSTLNETRPLMGLFIVCSLVAMVAPLTIVNPIGPRNFLPSYCLLVLLACLVYDNLFGAHPDAKIVPLRFLALFALFTWYRFYIPVAIVAHERQVLAQEATAQQALEVRAPKLPYSDYIHCSDPTSEPWTTRYKLFYGLDDKVTLVYE